MIAARRFVITGRVQGVGYRYFTVRAAERCGIAGTSRNLADGSVEVVAEGSADSLALFKTELERGPRSGHVDSVIEEPVEPANRMSFQIVY